MEYQNTSGVLHRLLCGCVTGGDAIDSDGSGEVGVITKIKKTFIVPVTKRHV